jgi:hypothetical protein
MDSTVYNLYVLMMAKFLFNDVVRKKVNFFFLVELKNNIHFIWVTRKGKKR